MSLAPSTSNFTEWMRLRLGLAALNHMTHCWLHLSFFFFLKEAIAQWGTGAIQSGDIPIHLPDSITFSSCQRFALQSTGRPCLKKIVPSKFDYCVTESFMVALQRNSERRLQGGCTEGRQMCAKCTVNNIKKERKSHRCAWVSLQWAVQACPKQTWELLHT